MSKKSVKKTLEKRMGLAVTGLGPFVRLDATSARFKKEVLRKGRWVHPGTGEKLEFDVPLLERLADDTNRWIALGQKVHFPVGADCHEEDARDARQNLGYWTNFRVEGERLVADVEVLEDAVVSKIGKTIQDVSPEIHWPARSATGELLEAAISHVAATPIPAIPGQSNFERLSQLAREVNVEDDETVAAHPGTLAAARLLQRMRDALGLPAEATEETVIDAMKLRVESAPAPAPEESQTLARLTREVRDARDEAHAAKKLAAELREQRAQEKRHRDEEAIQLARKASAASGLPIPEDTCKLALSLFSKNEDEAARELLSAHTARANDRKLALARTFEPDAGPERRVTATEDAAEKLLLERDGWTVKTKKDGAIKRDAYGRPRLERREKGKD